MSKNVAKIFPVRMKEYRERRLLSQSELAEQLGLSRATISNYENGKRAPGLLELDIIQRKTGISVKYFMGYSNTEREEYSEISSVTGLSDDDIEALIDPNLDLDAFRWFLHNQHLPDLLYWLRVILTPEIYAGMDDETIAFCLFRLEKTFRDMIANSLGDGHSAFDPHGSCDIAGEIDYYMKRARGQLPPRKRKAPDSDALLNE